MSKTPTAIEDIRLYRRLLTYVLPYKWAFVVAIFGMLLMSASDAVFIAMIQPIVDSGFDNRDTSFIRWIPLVLVALGVIRAIGTFVDGYCMSWVAGHVVQDLRQLMFDRLICAPVAYHDQNSSGMLTSRLIYNVNQVATASTTAVRIVVRDASKTIFLMGWMCFISWRLSLLFAIILPVAYLIFKISSRKFRVVSKRIQDSVGGILHVTKEALHGHRLVKIFGAYHHQRRLFFTANNRHRQQGMKATAVSSASVPLIVFLSSVGVAGVIWVALKQGISGGEFASYIAAMLMITKPVRSLAQINLIIQGGLAGAQSVFETVDLDQEIDRGTVELRGVADGVKFDKVSFKYDNGKPVLNGVSIDIAAGSTVALVGMSGGGKSTLASLLLRFYSPTGGNISIDGHPLDTLTLESLRANIAIVTQDIILFDDTIANNIVYGEKGKVDKQKLHKAAKAANVTAFTKDMPKGLNTFIGERGVRMSGGQRQRIAIARALYKNAPLLIMDEATSSLDTRSEAHIQTAIDRLIKNRTSLIIAHRLSTIENADKILVLEKGKIVQQGSHAELIAKPGVYARLQHAQRRNHAKVA